MPKRAIARPLPIADILNYLFENILSEDNAQYTEREVTEIIDIDFLTLKNIRSGKTGNPGLDTITQICAFFDVPLTVFQAKSMDEVKTILETRHQEPLNITTENPAVQEILLRASNLSEAGKQDILKLVRMVNQAEAFKRGEIAHLKENIKEKRNLENPANE